MASKQEDVVTTGNIENGNKTGYLKKRAISPIHEAIGAYRDVVDVNENYQVTYDSHTKIVELHESGDANPMKRMRCTNTDWELFHEEVVSQIMEGINEND